MRNGTGTRGPSGVELQPFIVPFSAFNDDHRATISDLLDQRGLLPN
jgi:hypothetical protein